ncbi:aldehyde dehydrogenase family protein [Azospirillum brasilense]|nr:aldehyde dehydrogenase family protein [Azospirillum brasilense]
MIKCQLEMGGKNPLIVLDDADLDVAVEAAVNGAFFQTGQRCTAASRLVVTEGIHDRFGAAVTGRLERLVVGHALRPETHIGPVVDERQLEQDLSHIATAEGEGAQRCWGGRVLERDTPGFYLSPCLLTETTNAMRINREEVFGPVASVVPVKDYDEALAVANDTPFSLSSGICTTSLKHATHFRAHSAAGLVMVNLPTAGLDFHVPFGGRKGSSYGPAIRRVRTLPQPPGIRSTVVLASWFKTMLRRYNPGRLLRVDEAGGEFSMATVQEALELAVEYHVQGGLTEARELYGRILAVEPHQPHALHLLGLLHGQEGRPVEAMALIRRAIASAPDIADFHANFGKLAMALGRTDEATAHHRRSLILRPGHPDALAGLAPLLAEGPPTDEAVSVIRQLLRLKPEDGGLCFSLARMLRARAEATEAATAYRRLIAFDPTHGAAWNNLGNLLRAGGAVEQAVTSFRRAARLAPGSAMMLVNLGAALADLGRTGAATEAFRRAIASHPDTGDAYFGLGSASAGRCAPDSLRVLHQGLRVAPDHPGLLYALGVLHAGRGEDVVATGLLSRGVEVAPDDAGCRLALCIGQLRPVYPDEAELESRREAYAHHLAALDGLIGPNAPAEARRNASDLAGAHLPFLLAYQGMDNRALQETHGGIMAGLMAARAGNRIPTITKASKASSRPRTARTRLRVGIVSSYFHDHSVWRAILAGWLTQLDPERFTLLGYHVTAEEDACTALAASRCAVFRRGLGAVERWAEAIVADRPDALLFPEVGMEPMTYRLAALRLAPVQAVAWGHPDTTGLPTLDHYLSGDLLEPPDGDAFYSERLVRLPNLGCHVEPTRRPAASVTRGRFGLPDGAPAFLCSQSLFKYLPVRPCVSVHRRRPAGQPVPVLPAQPSRRHPQLGGPAGTGLRLARHRQPGTLRLRRPTRP